MKSKPGMLLAVIVVLSVATDAWSLDTNSAWFRGHFSAGTRTPTPIPIPTRTPTPTPTPTTEPAPSDAFQVRYASNLNIGDSVVNLTNTGTQSGSEPAGNICANVYVFDPAEEMIACCSCNITPNGLNSFSARSDLISNPLTPAIPTSIIIKLLATTGPCNPSAPTAANLAPGLRAWGTTIHALPTSPVTYGVTETEFSPAVLSASELDNLTSLCADIEENGSGFGICRGCRTGGQ
jgi:hypothetical protein